MVLKGETIATGAPKKCPECEEELVLRVCFSPAGYYVGTYCNCGPNTRESGYYKTAKLAAQALESGEFGRD